MSKANAADLLSDHLQLKTFSFQFRKHDQVVPSIRVFLTVSAHTQLCLLNLLGSLSLSLLPAFHTVFLSWGEMRKEGNLDFSKQTPVIS